MRWFAGLWLPAGFLFAVAAAAAAAEDAPGPLDRVKEVVHGVIDNVAGAGDETQLPTEDAAATAAAEWVRVGAAVVDEALAPLLDYEERLGKTAEERHGVPTDPRLYFGDHAPAFRPADSRLDLPLPAGDQLPSAMRAMADEMGAVARQAAHALEVNVAPEGVTWSEFLREDEREGRQEADGPTLTADGAEEEEVDKIDDADISDLPAVDTAPLDDLDGDDLNGEIGDPRDADFKLGPISLYHDVHDTDDIPFSDEDLERVIRDAQDHLLQDPKDEEGQGGSTPDGDTLSDQSASQYMDMPISYQAYAAAGTQAGPDEDDAPDEDEADLKKIKTDYVYGDTDGDGVITPDEARQHPDEIDPDEEDDPSQLLVQPGPEEALEEAPTEKQVRDWYASIGVHLDEHAPVQHREDHPAARPLLDTQILGGGDAAASFISDLLPNVSLPSLHLPKVDIDLGGASPDADDPGFTGPFAVTYTLLWQTTLLFGARVTIDHQNGTAALTRGYGWQLELDYPSGQVIESVLPQWIEFTQSGSTVMFDPDEELAAIANQTDAARLADPVPPTTTGITFELVGMISQGRAGPLAPQDVVSLNRLPTHARLYLIAAPLLQADLDHPDDLTFRADVAGIVRSIASGHTTAPADLIHEGRLTLPSALLYAVAADIGEASLRYSDADTPGAAAALKDIAAVERASGPDQVKVAGADDGTPSRTATDATDRAIDSTGLFIGALVAALGVSTLLLGLIYHRVIVLPGTETTAPEPKAGSEVSKAAVTAAEKAETTGPATLPQEEELPTRQLPSIDR